MARRLGLQVSHLVNLWAGGAALLSFPFIHDPHWLLLPMLGMGLAWGSILSLPYALLSSSVPAKKMGVYMGILISSMGFRHWAPAACSAFCCAGSEEGRVGEEGRSRWLAESLKKKKNRL